MEHDSGSRRHFDILDPTSPSVRGGTRVGKGKGMTLTVWELVVQRQWDGVRPVNNNVV